MRARRQTREGRLSLGLDPLEERLEGDLPQLELGGVVDLKASVEAQTGVNGQSAGEGRGGPAMLQEDLGQCGHIRGQGRDALIIAQALEDLLKGLAHPVGRRPQGRQQAHV